MDNIINSIAEKNADNAKKCDYTNEMGLLVCGKCHQPKQCFVEFPTGSGNMRKFPIICRCDEEEERAFREKQSRQAYQDRIKELRRQGLTDKAYEKNTFENDDNRNASMSELCRKYVAHWSEMQESNTGILFYGNTGGGKSFYSCCIANALIEKGVKVIVTRLSDLVRNRTDKNSIDIELKQFDLVVLDDIGVENATQTAFNIIDDIYRANIPLIVTTNLAPSELKAPDSLEKQRIYDRVIERCCLTYRVDTVVSRLETAKANRENALKILNS